MVSFVVDDASEIVVHVLSPSAQLTIAVDAPGGIHVTPETVQQYGGEYFEVGCNGAASSPFMLLIQQNGTHQFMRLPSFGPGPYSIVATLVEPSSEDVAIIYEVDTDSDVRASMFVSDNLIGLTTSNGTVVPVAVAVQMMIFEGETPVSGAAVAAFGRRASSSDAEFPSYLSDDGAGVDLHANDGIYSGTIWLSSVGEYQINAVAQGATTAGTPFLRQDAAGVRVANGGAALTLNAGDVSDNGVDTNGDGLFEKIRIRIRAFYHQSGEYGLTVGLMTQGGQRFVAKGSNQSPGTHAYAYVSAEELMRLGEFGPFTITDAELARLDPVEGYVPCFRRLGLNIVTSAYSSLALQRPAFVLTGANDAIPIDSDQDGDWDQLEARVGVRARVSGQHSCVVAIFDVCETEIQTVHIQTELVAEENEQVVFRFSGPRIARRGVNGPYKIGKFMLHRTTLPSLDSAFYRARLFETDGYDVEQFDGFVARAPDCNNNGMPDDCEAGFSSEDCNSNGVPDECEPDADCDSVPDSCDSNHDCAAWLVCDANCDGFRNNFDIDPFVLALIDENEYRTQFPNCCRVCVCDANGDGMLNNFDISPFVDCVAQP